MIEEVLIQYGAIGACLIYFMVDKLRFQNSLERVIENNTIAITKVYEIIAHCPKTKV